MAMNILTSFLLAGFLTTGFIPTVFIPTGFFMQGYAAASFPTLLQIELPAPPIREKGYVPLTAQAQHTESDAASAPAALQASASEKKAERAGGIGRASGFASGLRSRGVPALLVTGLISMLPIFELRGGIPVGMAIFKLNPISAFAVSVLFNLIPIFPLLLLLNPVKAFFIDKGILKGFFQFLEKKASKNRKLVEKYEEIGLALFVAVPLPATGAWTGAVVAVAMGLKPLKSFLFITLGVLGAGCIVSLATLLGLKSIG